MKQNSRSHKVLLNIAVFKLQVCQTVYNAGVLLICPIQESVIYCVYAVSFCLCCVFCFVDSAACFFLLILSSPSAITVANVHNVVSTTCGKMLTVLGEVV